MIPQLLWLPSVRRNEIVLFLISLGVIVGMWLERFVIVIPSLSHNSMPSEWGVYYPTLWDWATLAGTIGLFMTIFFVILRLLPIVSIAEVREIVDREELAVSEQRLYGLIGVFATADAVMMAARQLHSLGFRAVEAYTPYPVEGLDELLRPGRSTWLPPAIAIGAVFGAVWGYFIQYWDEALELSDQCRRPSAQQLAGLYRRHLRVHRAVRDRSRVFCAAGLVPPAASLSPDLCGTRIRPGLGGPVRAMRRGARPELRAGPCPSYLRALWR